MTEPAPKATPEELIRELTSPAPSEVFDFIRVKEDGSRKKIPIRVRVLRVDEQLGAIADAQTDARTKKEVPGEYGDIYRESQAVQLLRRAIVHIEPKERNDGTSWYPPVFVTAEQLRQSFTPAEMAQALNMHEFAKAKFGAIEAFSEEDVERYIDELAGPLGPSRLSLLDSSHWPVLLIHMARLASRYRDTLGLKLPSSPDSSGSAPSSSGSDTGSFSSLPEGHSADGEELPTDHLMTADEARRRAEQLFKTRPTDPAPPEPDEPNE